MQGLNELSRLDGLVPHGYCLNWDTALLWLTAVSDAAIALSCSLISLGIAYVVWRSKDLQYRWLLPMCVAFFVVFGATQLLSLVTIWLPLYWLGAWVKLIAALVSVATAVGMLWVIPRALTLPGPKELRVQRDAAQYARSLIEASLDPLVTISPDGKITDVNLATETATGKSRVELIGTDFPDYFTEPDKAREGYQQVLRNGRVTDYPLTLRHVSTGTMDVAYNASVYRNERGEVLGVFAAARDVTAHKQAQAQLHKHHAHLEELLQERTSQLETANKELEGFAYSVSHDLRAPLRAIDGFSQQVLKRYADKLDDEGQRYLNVVRDNTRKMGQLIDDILAFSRMGRQAMSSSDVDMDAMAHATVEELTPSFAGREVTMDIKPLPLCHGDPAMLRKVWTNLLSNAIKFSRQRTLARIEVQGHTEGAETIYSIKDNGAGFDMQYADKLFGVFQRLHGITEFEGTGIGLAIVKRIITRHGGRVWAQGKVEEGATFYFALPVQEKST